MPLTKKQSLSLSQRFKKHVSSLADEYFCKKCESMYSYIQICNHKYCSKCNPLKSTNKCMELNCICEFVERDLKDIQIDGLAEIIGNFRTCLQQTENPITCSLLQNNLSIPINVHFFKPSPLNHKGENLLFRLIRRKKAIDLDAALKSKMYDVNHKDYAGWSPLHEAVQCEFVEGVELLLEAGALPNIPGCDQQTPLHKAVEVGNESIYRILLQYGASPNCCNSKGVKAIFRNCNDIPKDIKCRIKTTYISSVCIVHTQSKLIKTRLAEYKITFKDTLSKAVTHLIVAKNQQLSFTTMSALLKQMFIFEEDWLVEYKENKMVMPLDFKYIPVDYPAYKRAFIGKLLKLPRLFEGLHIFVDNVLEYKFNNLTFKAAHIKELISEGGGVNLRRIPTPSIAHETLCIPYFSDNTTEHPLCCFYILYDENAPPQLRYNMKELAHKPIKWLFDCILEYKIL